MMEHARKPFASIGLAAVARRADLGAMWRVRMASRTLDVVTDRASSRARAEGLYVGNASLADATAAAAPLLELLPEHQLAGCGVRAVDSFDAWHQV